MGFDFRHERHSWANMTQIYTFRCYEFCFPWCTMSNLSCSKRATYSHSKTTVENISKPIFFILCKQMTIRKSSHYFKFWTSIAFKTKIWKRIYFLHILLNCPFTVRISKYFKSKQERKNLVCAILSSEKSLGKAKHPSNHHRWNRSASKM